MDEIAPYVKPPLRIEQGRIVTCSLEDSIRHNIKLILANHIQGVAKSEEIAADPGYGSDLAHHNFRQGTVGELVQGVKQALRRNEQRFVVDKVVPVGKNAGRYLPYRIIRIIGKVAETDQRLEIEFDLEA